MCVYIYIYNSEGSRLGRREGPSRWWLGLRTEGRYEGSGTAARDRGGVAYSLPRPARPGVPKGFATMQSNFLIVEGYNLESRGLALVLEALQEVIGFQSPAGTKRMRIIVRFTH